MGAALAGKNVLITGATNGIGRATAIELVKQGAELFLLCRDREKAAGLRAELLVNNPRACVTVLLADLGDFASVRKAVDAFKSLNKPLHVLINNAGIINTERKLQADGIEQMFAVNHLGPFLLTTLLLEVLQASAPARIVNVASEAYTFCKGIRLDDLGWERDFATFKAYGNSKLANILFTRELARHLDGTQVTVNALHPGAVSSGLGKQNGRLARIVHWLISPFAKTPLQGAQTSVYLATSPQLEGVNGKYFADCKIKTLKPWARDEQAAEKLWALSERLASQ